MVKEKHLYEVTSLLRRYGKKEIIEEKAYHIICEGQDLKETIEGSYNMFYEVLSFKSNRVNLNGERVFIPVNLKSSNSRYDSLKPRFPVNS